MIGRLFTHILQQIGIAVKNVQHVGRTSSAQGGAPPRETHARLTELAASVGLAQTAAEQLSEAARWHIDAMEDIERIAEAYYDTGERIHRATQQLGQTVGETGKAAQPEPRQGAPQRQPPRQLPPMLGIGTTRVVSPVMSALTSTTGAGPSAGAAAGAALRLPPALLPLLKAFGLLAGVGFVLVKTFQTLTRAADKAAFRLLGIFDQFADVSPAAAGMRALLEVYRRRDRMAVAAVLGPQWRRELESYRELLENTRSLRILSQQIASTFRTILNRILARIAAIYDWLQKQFGLEPMEEKTEQHPLVRVLLDILREQNLPRDWRPLPPRRPRAG